MPTERISCRIESTPGMSPIVSRATLPQRHTRRFHQSRFQLLLTLVQLRQLLSHLTSYKHRAIHKRSAASHSKLLLFSSIPGHQLHHRLCIRRRRCQIITPTESRSSRQSIIIQLKPLLHVVRTPPETNSRTLILRQTPGHQVAKRTHTILLDMVPPEIKHRQIDKTTHHRISLMRNLPLTAINPQLPSHRAINPAKRSPCVRTGQRPPEIALSHRPGHRHQKRHKLRRTPRHHPINRHQLHRHLATRRQHHRNNLLSRKITERQKLRHRLPRRRKNRQTIRPPPLSKKSIHLRHRARHHHPILLRRSHLRHPFPVGQRLRKSPLNLRPQNPARIFPKHLMRMRGKSARVLSHTSNRHTRRASRRPRLIDETGSRNHHRRNPLILRRNTRPHLPRRTQTAPPITSDHRIHLHLTQASDKSILPLTNNPRPRPRPSRPNLIQQQNTSRRILLLNQVLQLRMRHISHKTATHQSKSLTLQRIQPRPLLNHPGMTPSHRRKHSITPLLRISRRRTLPIPTSPHLSERRPLQQHRPKHQKHQPIHHPFENHSQRKTPSLPKSFTTPLLPFLLSNTSHHRSPSKKLPQTGLEPVQPKRPGDFKSPASTIPPLWLWV